MSQLRIRGGKPLNGTVNVRGNKNAATPILAATLLTSEPCRISNVPRIRDVENMLEIIERFGAEVAWESPNQVLVHAKNITPVIEQDTIERMKSMRSSVLFFGPLVARLGQVRLPYPGGCDLGARSIETHLTLFRDLGYEVRAEKSWVEITKGRGASAKKIVLPDFSVTATENALMVTALLPQKTSIHIAASEPHVQDLSRFLSTLGARVAGIGSHDLVVEGQEKLDGGEHKIAGDFIVAGTLLTAALATGGSLTIKGVDPHELHSVIALLSRAGARIEEGENSITVSPSPNLVMERIQTMPYPGIPTDLQAALSVLATQTDGVTLIHETLYEGRFRIADELKKMGAQFESLDSHRVEIKGPTKLQGAAVTGSDLRGTAALVLAGLVADGETIVSGTEQVERGYEDFAQQLRALGADIETV